MYIEKVTEMVPPLSQNTVGVCNQITLLILYYISSRLRTLVKILMPLHRSLDIFDLAVSFMFINVSAQILLFLFLKCLLASHYLDCFGLDPVTTAF